MDDRSIWCPLNDCLPGCLLLEKAHPRHLGRDRPGLVDHVGQAAVIAMADDKRAASGAPSTSADLKQAGAAGQPRDTGLSDRLGRGGDRIILYSQAIQDTRDLSLQICDLGL